ncbi:hypothetical protein CRG98_036149 [Punica granatum]|uniref:Uncharacterized protein n=1 Tax=Punica granatum TaxID=22663 RepID=A0A2I0IHA9_PUNGR|nr:hypothetical protein CRG98_036149 [Punica granatum]
MNTNPEVMSMPEVGLKYEIVTVYIEADRMEDSDDDGVEAMVAGDSDEEDTDDDIWEAEDGEEDEIEIDDSNICGYEDVSDGENKEFTQFKKAMKSYTIVNDFELRWRGAGLEKAVKTLLPRVKHRVCARRVYSNWKKKYNEVALKHLFWRSIMNTTEATYLITMGQMEVLSKETADVFRRIDVRKFCRAYINNWNACEVVDNNINECFND